MKKLLLSIILSGIAINAHSNPIFHINDIKYSSSANDRVTIDYKNNTNTQWEYITFQTRASSARGGFIPAQVSGDNVAHLRKAVMPSDSLSGSSRTWQNVWSSPGIQCLEVIGIEAIRPNGEFIQIPEHLISGTKKICDRSLVSR